MLKYNTNTPLQCIAEIYIYCLQTTPLVFSCFGHNNLIGDKILDPNREIAYVD